jgi:hypothetical protein
LHVLLSNVIVRQIFEFVLIREIDDREHENSNYVILNLYIDEKIKNKSIIVHIKRDVHIIDDLKIKMLIDFDIIYSKKMTIDLKKKKFIIINCDLTISITCTSTIFRINRIFRFKQIVIIFTHTILIVFFKFQKNKFELFVERNYIFQSHVIFINFDAKENIMIHIMNNNFSFVHVRNVTNKFIILSKHIKLNKFFDYDEKNCYYANVFEIYLIVDVN